MGKDIDPADIGKHPDVIRKAQAEFSQTDVLVCGRCHSVFHFVDPFREHKELDCKKDSTLKECTEAKGKVWAFLLWKSAQLSSEGDGGTVNSWKLYQTWVKLEEAVRETWIVAGRTIQSFAKTGQGTLQEMPVKITKTVVETGDSTDKKPTIGSGNPQTAANRFPAARKPDPKVASASSDMKKPGAPTTPVKKPEMGMKNIKRSFAKRSIPMSPDVQEEEVEKILAKRFNPRRKEHEYLVKWTKLAHDQNTWEPLIHLQTCQSVLEYFEVQLAKQKEQRAAAAARTLQQQQEKNKMALTATANNVSSPASPAVGPLSNNNIRPVRSSKTNATDRVKQWCGTTSPQADDTPTSKRKAGESDPESPEQDEPSKRMRSDGSSINQAITKVAQTGNVKIVPVGSNSSTAINGGISNVARKDETNMAEVVIKSSRDNIPSGVVKKPGVPTKKPESGEATVKIIYRGEYGSPGIFKTKPDTVSPQTSPVAQSGSPTTTTTTRFIRKTVNGTPQLTKQTIRQTVPVSKSSPVTQQRTQMPKQGTSNVPLTKVGTTTLQRSPLSPKVQTTSTTVTSKALLTRTVAKPVAKITPSEQKINALRKQGLNVVKRLVSSSTNNEARHEEEEDDGLVDPFPSNLPPPTPPSPPRALTLCPVTGKVLGQAEGEPTPVPSPEVEEDKKDIKIKKDDELADQQNVQEQDTQVQQFLTNEDGSPIIVAGEDGTLYQVAGKNAEGQTILIAQGADGEQSCVLVASNDEDGGAGGVLTLDAAVSEAVAQISVPQEGQLTDEQASQFQTVDQSQQLTIQTEDSQDGQITAEVVQADQPSPGGTRRVVLLLPDGSFMMTEVNEEQYQSLNLVT